MPVPDPNTFTGALLDRAADGRRTDAAWVHEQLSHPGARAVLAADEGMRVRDGHLALVPLSEAPAPVDDGVPLLLGLDDDGPVFAIDEGPATEPGRRPAFVGAGGRRGEPPPTDDEHLGLREAAQTLDQAESGAGRLRRGDAELAPQPPLLRQLRHAHRRGRGAAWCAPAPTAAPSTTRAWTRW